MPPIDLANIKTRLIGCGAIQLVGQTISAALSGSTASTLGGASLLMLGSSVLGTIASDLAGGMMATELGNHITERFSKNRNILDNHDLTLAAGEAIAYILKEVAQSDRLIAIAETKNLPYQAEPFNQLANKTVEYWLNINTNTEVASFSGDAEFNCCAISPDGVTVVAGDVSGRVHFLRLEGMGDLCAEARNRVSS